MLSKAKVLSLRDLAIDYLPKARKLRADAMKYQGGIGADTGLNAALTFVDYAATATEVVAYELLQLTFMHPDTRPIDPHTWDAAEDAETIATIKHNQEMCVEMQPETEVLMFDAAKQLCELSGAPLPPWMTAKVEAMPDTKTSPTAKVGSNKKTWDDAKLRALWDESNMPYVTQRSLAEKYDVTRQRIATLLKIAKNKFSSSRSSLTKNAWGHTINQKA